MISFGEKDLNGRIVNFYIPLFLVIIGFFWKLFYIDQRDICIDEPFTIFAAQKSIGEILKISTTWDPTPPLFTILLHIWVKLFGTGPIAVRFLPLLFNAITVLFLYFTGKRFFSLWTGILASGLFLFSNLHFLYALNTRTYSLVSLETAAALYFYLRYLHDLKDRNALAGLIIANLSLVYSHYFGWFIIFSQVITGVLYIRDMKMFFRIMIPPLATLAGFAPMLPVILRQFLAKTHHGTWLNPPNPDAYLHSLYAFFNYKEVMWLILGIMGVGALFTIIKALLKKWKGFNINVIVLLSWWLFPYSIMFLASSEVPMFNNSYNLFHTIGLYLFVGAALNFLFQKNMYIEPLAGLVILISMLLNMKILPEYLAYREVKRSVDFVNNKKDENTVVILFPYWSDLQFIYYYDRGIYNQFDHYYDLMKKQGIYRVWGYNEMKAIIDANPDKKIIYLQDGGVKEENIKNLNCLDSAYALIDSAFFPQTIHARVYEPFINRLQRSYKDFMSLELTAREMNFYSGFYHENPPGIPFSKVVVQFSHFDEYTRFNSSNLKSLDYCIEPDEGRSQMIIYTSDEGDFDRIRETFRNFQCEIFQFRVIEN